MRPLAVVNVDLAIDAVTLAISLAVAEAFFRFHSFTLEALAFLAVWFALRGAGKFLLRRTR